VCGHLFFSRAAPEVKEWGTGDKGRYSTASDVYCFAVLVWWVLDALERAAQAYDVYRQSDYSLYEVGLYSRIDQGCG
jgi:hypothetical protein